jgi:addiction module RelE/StbE family toxin
VAILWRGTEISDRRRGERVIQEYSLFVSRGVDKKPEKLCKKDKKQFEAVNRKVKQILENPCRFKALKEDMTGARRAHVGSFVLVYEVDEKRKCVRILDYGDHDEVYG